MIDVETTCLKCGTVTVQRMEDKPVGYKAGFEFEGQHKLSFNTHVFATREEANTAGNELMSRWFLPIGIQIIKVDTEPNAIIQNGKPIGMSQLEVN